MNIGFFSPYLDSLSGGERYVLTLASHWSKSHRVSLFWDDPNIIRQSEERFNLDLSHVSVVDNVFTNGTLVTRLFATSQYDCMFFLSDGSIPTSCAPKNILHFQVPFPNVSVPMWKRNMTRHVVCNSVFTKNALDPSVGTAAQVIYPPVDVSAFSPSKKERIILSVGRFSPVFQAKKQETLIDIFAKGYANGELKNWKLVLAGSLFERDQSYMDSLTQRSKGLPVTLIPNIPFGKLKDLYASAAIYWHAAGFGETDPRNMEHFGITTVEAMAAGCVPVVYAAGGQPEIVSHDASGYLWTGVEECLEYTNTLIANTGKMKRLGTAARTRAADFTAQRFCESFDRLLEGMAG